jgi:hypothetical protein
MDDKIYYPFFCAIHFFIYLCGMEKGKLLKDSQISVIKKFLCKNMFNLNNRHGWKEYNDTVIKITSIRKYEYAYNQWRENKRFIYEVDVIVDMKCDYWCYTTSYQKRNAREANRYSRRFIERTINEEIKYFGLTQLDEVVVKKITWDYL